MPVVAVKEASFLPPVNRVVGGIEVDGDDAGFARDTFDTLVDEEVAKALRVRFDLFGFVQSIDSEFKAVNGALAREAFTLVLFGTLFTKQVFLVTA
jgi:hypothetical protein